MADSAYGDNLELERALVRADVRHVRGTHKLAHRGAVGRCWAPVNVAHSFAEAIEALPREAWVAVERRFRSGPARGGRAEAWWAGQGYKRVKGKLGWADFQVRSDRAIRRHWALVCCAFSSCWAHEAQHAAPPAVPHATDAPPCWPVALRRVRAWLAPWAWLARCWRGWANTPPPPTLAALLDAVAGGRGLNLYAPI